MRPLPPDAIRILAAQRPWRSLVFPEGVPVEYAEQTSSLFGGQPIAHPNAKLFGTFDPSNSGGEVRTEQTGIRGFVCKAATAASRRLIVEEA
jgi:hypothetical protein